MAGDIPPSDTRKSRVGTLLTGAVSRMISRGTNATGPAGMVVGAVARRIVRRSPVTALVIGGAWIGHKLYKRNQERKFDEAAHNAKPAKIVEQPSISSDLPDE